MKSLESDRRTCGVSCFSNSSSAEFAQQAWYMFWLVDGGVCGGATNVGAEFPLLSVYVLRRVLLSPMSADTARAPGRLGHSRIILHYETYTTFLLEDSLCK